MTKPGTTREDKGDFLSQLSRVCATVCSHSVKDFERCELCNVLLFERPIDALRDIPFADLLVASPRYKPLSSRELEATIARMHAENEVIASDANTKFRKQIDFLNAQLEQASLSVPLTPGRDKRVNPPIVFQTNLVEEERGVMFPKVALDTFPSADLLLKRDLTSGVSIESTDENIINLASESSVSTSILRVFLPPYREDPLVVQVDGIISVEDVIEAILNRHGHLLDVRVAKWCLRWTEDDDTSPDHDLPAVDSSQIVMILNAKELCLCPDADSEG